MNEEQVADSIESQFARRLAGNEKKIRDKALKKLKKYMSLRSQKSDGGFARDEMLRIWKGLFYCMWMSDKPLIQEELSKNMSSLMLDFNNTKTAMLFFDVFLQTMLREWMGIDRLRMDKFYLLVRNMLEVSFRFLKSKEWDVGIIDWFLAILKSGPISPVQPYSGMHYHFCDIYLEELALVADNSLSSELVMKFLDPYCIFITKARNNDLVSMVVSEVFEQLVENSKPALDILAEEEDDELILPIRSHTQMPSSDCSPIASLAVDYNKLADKLFELASEEGVLAKSKKKAYTLVEKFREIAQGRLPLDDIPDGEYSSEDELKVLETNLTNAILENNAQEFDDNQRSKKSKWKKRSNVDKVDTSAHVVPTTVQRTGGECDDQGSKSEAITKKHIKGRAKGKEREKSKPARSKVAKNKASDCCSVARKKKRNNSEVEKMEYVTVDSNTVDKLDKLNGGSSDIQSCLNDKVNQSDEIGLITDNMPDLIQDVTKCAQVAKPVTKVEGDQFAKLRKWLDTGTTPVCTTMNATDFAEEPTRKKAKKVAMSTVSLDGNTKKITKKINKSIKKKSDKSTSLAISAPQFTKSQPNKKSKEEIIITTTIGSENISHHEKTCSLKETSSRTKITRIDKGGDKMNSLPVNNTFLNSAKKKLEKTTSKRRAAAMKRKEEPVKYHSPKRVAFEMSKTQIKPFRKTDKAIACSPSPATIAFDPMKRPDYGLLKTRKNKLLKSKASDFFDNA